MRRDFDVWLSTFRESIANYEYYTDFSKVYHEVEKIKVELNILNSLIGLDDIENKFEELITRYPEVLKCIPILLAVRENQIYAEDSEGEFDFSFKSLNYSVEQYKVFMRKTGLFGLLQNHIINNLVDYVTGVEAGIGSNGRKNRGGHLMEDLVERYIIECGFEKDVSYFKEMNIKKMQKRWGVSLATASNQGKTEKRFDFVVRTQGDLYLIETNFYGSQGSKLNETARSYKMLSSEIDATPGVNFVWFTDGLGWNKSRHNLEEAFDSIKHIYNINDMKNGIMGELLV